MADKDTFTITIDDAVLRRRLDRLALVNKLAIYRPVAAGLQTLIDLTFKRGVDPWGNKWAPLKLRKGQPLRDKGTLKASLTPKVSEQGITIGSNLRYAAVHQFGATIAPKQAKMLAWRFNGLSYFAKKVVIPRRAFLPLAQDGTLLIPPTWEQQILGRMRSAIDAELLSSKK